MSDKQAAENIIKNVGGADNFSYLTHCATRLRFNLKDKSQVDEQALDAIPEVMGVVNQNDQTQVIIGGGVANVYQAMIKEPGMQKLADGGAEASSAQESDESKKNSLGTFIDKLFDILSDTFRPILWALLGASMILTGLVIASNFVTDEAQNGANWQFVEAMAKSVFYFLPIMVGATAANKMGANTWVGAAIPAAFLTPQFLGLKDFAHDALVFGKTVETAPGELLQAVDVFGLNLFLYDYGGQVFPPLFAVAVLAVLERFLKKIVPTAIQMVFVPTLSLLIMIPFTAFVIGPFGIFLGDGLSSVFQTVYTFSPVLFGMLVAASYLFMVPIGLHWPLNAVMINNIAVLGYDFIQPAMGAYNFAVFGLVTGVLLIATREKNQEMKQVASGSVFAGLLGGISEPSLYGVVLRYRRTIPIILVSAVIGGGIVGFFKVEAMAFVFTSLITIPAMQPWIFYLLGIAVSYFCAMIGVLIFGYRTPEQKAEDQAKISARNAESVDSTGQESSANNMTSEQAESTSSSESGAVQTLVKEKKVLTQELTTVTAPLTGEVIPMAEIPDPVFAQGMAGTGVGMIPVEDTVYAPEDGKILVVQPHAVGIRLANGVDLLVHVGIDTVNMNGEGFQSFVQRGDLVKAGDKLMSFDLQAILEAGYSPVTPVLVTNPKKFGEITVTDDLVRKVGEELLRVSPKASKQTEDTPSV